MDDWPVSLPQKPLQEGFSATKVDGRLRTSMSEGPEKVRRRFTATSENLTCAFHLSAAQLTTFNTFFDTTLVGGSLAYNWVHPVTSVACICRIQDMPMFAAVGVEWQVSFIVEVLP